MSYQVLARRLRPKDFDGLVGQDHVVRALRNGLDSGRVHHAYLFTGTRGVGKTTIARILAKSLNCEVGVSSSPCGTCSICREVEENRFIDLVEVDAASRTRVDDTRELLDNAQYVPSRGRYKVYLIDEVHMLSASSFNAFLKTLEEPPEHVKFLLATTDAKKVPVTVLSRCLQFQLKNIGRDEIARYIGEVLTAEGVEFEPEAPRIIAKSARGSMRDALSIADQAIAYSRGALTAADVAAMVGAAGRDETGAVMAALASGDPGRVLTLSAALADKAVDFGSVLADVLEALHGMAVGQALGETAVDGLSPEAVHLYYQIALIGYRDLHIGPDPKTGFEMTLLRMLAFAPDAASAARVPAAVAGQPESSRAAPAPPEAGGAGPGDQGATAPPGGKVAVQRDAAAPSGGKVVVQRDTAAPSGGRVVVQRDVTAPSHNRAVPQPAATVRTNDEAAPANTVDDGLCREWYELVERLGLKGIDRMIAENSLLVERSTDRYRLVLDRRHQSLLNGGNGGGLERALASLSGAPVRLVIDIGEPAAETPAARKMRLADERQAAAQRQLEGNARVQALIGAFDGHLEQVRPLDTNRSDKPGVSV